eukprot:COSAG01_NODE_2900_length_6892_cov_34.502871_8_plen_224_part_00
MNAAGQIPQADIDAALRLPTPDEQRLSLVNLLSQALVSEMSETATNASSSLANTNSRAESVSNVALQRASPSSPGSAGGSPRKANSPRKSQERDPKTGAPKGVLRRTATNRSGRILDQPSSIRASGLATQEEAETEFEEDEQEEEDSETEAPEPALMGRADTAEQGSPGSPSRGRGRSRAGSADQGDSEAQITPASKLVEIDVAEMGARHLFLVARVYRHQWH